MAAAPELPPHLQAAVTRNPDLILRELDRLDAQDRLRNFVQAMWPVLEPRRPLVWGWAFDAICEHLEAIHYGHVRRLLINVPPGMMKSLLVNVFFPAWEWGPRDRADLRYVCFSYSQTLTIRDNRRCRQVILSDDYQAFWGERFFLVADQNAKVRYDTNRTGFKIATSVGGTGTGERGDRCLLDDPNNVKDVESEKIRGETAHFFAEVLPSRLNDPDESAIAVIQQRTHTGDVSGLILKHDLGYDHLCLPMEHETKRRCFTSVPREGALPEKVRRCRVEGEPIPLWLKPGEKPVDLMDDDVDEDGEHERPDPHVESMGDWELLYSQDPRTEEDELLCEERFSRRHLEEDLKPPLRMMGGTYAEAGQLQQRPVPRGGGMFQRKDFRLIDIGDVPAGLLPARGYDLAASDDATSAYSAAVKIAVHRGRVYILHAERRRGTPAVIEEWMQALAKTDGKRVEIDIPQDPGQAGKWQKGYLADVLDGYTVRSSPESGDKVDRAKALAAAAELGQVYVVRGPWNDTFIAELCLFPRGDFKDLVDASSRAYARARLLARNAPPIPSAPEEIRG